MSTSPISTITRAATRLPGERLNVLTFPTHERWASGLAGCNATFFLLMGPAPGIKPDWNTKFAPVPANHILLNPQSRFRTVGGQTRESLAWEIPTEVDIDVVLSQSLGQYPHAKEISDALHIPLIRLEHVLPDPSVREQFAAVPAHILVTVSEYNRRQSGFPEGTRIVHHGIDTDFWTPGDEERENRIITVANEFVSRGPAIGYEVWKQTTDFLPTDVIHLVGDTPGLSKAAADTAELRSFYRQAKVYLNTTLASSCPMSPLEAMACGCAIVSTNTTSLPDIIKHGQNGFLASPDEPGQLANYCQQLLDDPDLCRQIGEAARKTVVEMFSTKRFVAEWDSLFREAADTICTRSL